jgi:hypothetical protein
MVSAPGINFTNVSHTAFTCADPEMAKKEWQLDFIFPLLGYALVKVLRNMLVKLAPTDCQNHVTKAMRSVNLIEYLIKTKSNQIFSEYLEPINTLYFRIGFGYRKWPYLVFRKKKRNKLQNKTSIFSLKMSVFCLWFSYKFN